VGRTRNEMPQFVSYRVRENHSYAGRCTRILTELCEVLDPIPIHISEPVGSRLNGRSAQDVRAASQEFGFSWSNDDGKITLQRLSDAALCPDRIADIFRIDPIDIDACASQNPNNLVSRFKLHWNGNSRQIANNHRNSGPRVGFAGFANKGHAIMTHQPRTIPVIHRLLPITPSIGEGAGDPGKPPRFELFLRDLGWLC
jgi:hypothetical protein